MSAESINAERLLKEYEVLEKKAHELKGELRCRHDCGAICVTPEVTQAKQELIEVTMRMDEINEVLGREKKVTYH
ncbi:MAG TPA: hypothetical protein VE439_10220 [Anaerolineae bacterium]|nr:hypothetical protein [Anaerolineae bacterium]